MSGGLTKFWLVSSLKISPLEQVMIQERKSDAVLSWKMGYAGSGLGWFVGYVERNNNVYFFATEAEGKNLGPGKASEITLKILADKKLF